MNFDPNVLDEAELVALSLRTLYRGRGYTRYRMSKFEEYDLYGRYKDFLISDRVLTFTDTDGTLLALKPDVTLSIIRHSKDRPETLQRLCYNENVYRVAPGGGGFREIPQAGVECIGAVTPETVGGVLALAADSLALCSPRWMLEISDLSLLTACLDDLSPDPAVRETAFRLAGEKNCHELTALCRERSIPEEKVRPLLNLLSLSGPLSVMLPRLRAMPGSQVWRWELADLETSLTALAGQPEARRIQLEFSLTGDRNYYNGVIFRGYLEGVGAPVLSGGQYDRLMERMGRRSRAIGFAVYLDRLERLAKEGE